jgi:hypothetical protein
MTTGLQRTQVLRFPPGTGAVTSRRRSLREILAVGRLRAAFPRRSLARRNAAVVPSPARTARARDVHDAAIARGIAPPF